MALIGLLWDAAVLGLMAELFWVVAAGMRLWWRAFLHVLIDLGRLPLRLLLALAAWMTPRT